MPMSYIIEKGLEGVDSIDNCTYQSLIYAKNSARQRVKLYILALENHWKLQHILKGEYTKLDVIDVINRLRLQDKITESFRSYLLDQNSNEQFNENHKKELIAVIANNMNAVTSY